MMSQSISGPGYFQVMLTKNGGQRPHYVHRLVAEAFIDNPNNLPEVDHIDANKLNNNVKNLRWVTPKENHDNTVRHGHNYDGTSNFFGPENIVKRYDRCRRPVVRSDGAVFESVTSAAKNIGVKPQSITRVLNDSSNTKRCHGYTFEYLPK
jgi:hypothetical protein